MFDPGALSRAGSYVLSGMCEINCRKKQQQQTNWLRIVNTSFSKEGTVLFLVVLVCLSVSNIIQNVMKDCNDILLRGLEWYKVEQNFCLFVCFNKKSCEHGISKPA